MIDEKWISKQKPPPEKIIRVDVLAAVFNKDKMLKDRKCVVDLACGHKAYGKLKNHMVCPRCTEMLRRSLRDGSEDYEGYRHGNVQDRMIWRDDPCRQLNEPTDLGGNFIYDPEE